MFANNLNGPEYEERYDYGYCSLFSSSHLWPRLGKPFIPPTVTLKDIHDAVPKHLLKSMYIAFLLLLFSLCYHYVENATKSIVYVLRDITFAALLFKLASCITPLAEQDFGSHVTSGWKKTILASALWLSYWWVQGMVFAGIFCLGKFLVLAAILFPRPANITSRPRCWTCHAFRRQQN
jgi:hypothetical protein